MYIPMHVYMCVCVYTHYIHVHVQLKKRRGWQEMKWSDGITDSVVMNLSELWETVKDREAWHATVHGAIKSRTQFSN